MYRHSNAMTVQILRISFFLLLSQLNEFRCYVSVAKRQAVWLPLNCVKEKYLWALPTPTTFEKVDQTFYFGTESLAFALLCCPTET